MRTENLSRVWVTTPVREAVDGEAQGGYTNLRSFHANFQSDRNEVDAAAYGERVDGIIKLRTSSLPPVAEHDRLSLSEPTPLGSFTAGGKSHVDYGPGEYEAVSVQPAAGRRGGRNPTVITAKKVH